VSVCRRIFYPITICPRKNNIGRFYRVICFTMVLQGGQFAGDLRLPANDPTGMSSNIAECFFIFSYITGMRANKVQRKCLRMSAISVRANTHTLQDYQCNVPTYASPPSFPIWSRIQVNMQSAICICVSLSLAHSCPPSLTLTTSFLYPYLPPSVCPLHCLHRYVGQTTVPDSSGWRLPPQHETSVLEELS
jgi:hypothetical protein